MIDNFAWSEEPDPDAPTLARHHDFLTRFYGPTPVYDYPETAPTIRVPAPTAAMRASPVSSKSRVIAGCLSLFTPGLGRFYMGDSHTGNRYAGAWLLGSALCLSLIGIHIGIPLLVYAHVASFVDALLIWAGASPEHSRDGEGREMRFW